jgi:ACS family hexuronate transporter-like MFS transporter
MRFSEGQLRWMAVSVLVLSSALNYLDRMVLTALMPVLQDSLGASREQLGAVLSAFSIVYAFSSPLMGLLIDGLGLRWGTALVVALWSAVGIATGFTSTLAGLMVCRALLGFAEAGGIPATGKGFAVYLPPEHRATGGALSQVGLTLGSMGAPLLTEWLFPLYGWRSAFVVSGALGFVWLPLWILVSAKVPPTESATAAAATRTLSVGELLRDRRMAALVVANILAMTIYSLWTNWTTLFLVTNYGIAREQANLQFVWIPPIFATAGGLLGGWLALRLMRGGMAPLAARVRISTVSAVFATATGLAAIVGGPVAATVAICVSLAATTCLSVNYYALPLDLFGPARAAFAVSMLTGVFGLMQAFLSPLIGRWSVTLGWAPVCIGIAMLPIASVVVLRAGFRVR